MKRELSNDKFLDFMGMLSKQDDNKQSFKYQSAITSKINESTSVRIEQDDGNQIIAILPPLVSQVYTANKSQIISKMQIKKTKADSVPTFASPKESNSKGHKQYAFQSIENPIISKSKRLINPFRVKRPK